MTARILGPSSVAVHTAAASADGASNGRVRISHVGRAGEVLHIRTVSLRRSDSVCVEAARHRMSNSWLAMTMGRGGGGTGGGEGSLFLCHDKYLNVVSFEENKKKL